MAEKALFTAARQGDLATLTRLVEEGVNVNAANEHGMTALMWAADNGHLDCLDHLIAKGADLNAQNKTKWAALHLAANSGRAPCVESLLKAGADASLKKNGGNTALDDAKAKGHTEVIKILENPAAYLAAQAEAEGALLNAAEKGDLATLTRLVEEGVNVNAANEHGQTALMLAAHNNKLDCLDHLIAKGANVNTQENGKCTALHLAAYHGHAPCVESLLKAGADASLKNWEDKTALDDAKRQEHTEVINILEKYDPAYLAAQETAAAAAAANAAAKMGAREAAARATWAEPGTHKPTTLTRAATLGLKRWHFFLSHTQRNGDAKSVALELFFGFNEQGKKIWLDVKMPKMDMEAMKDGVNGSRCVLAIITGGDDKESRYFQRPMCVEELKWAVEAGVKIVPVVTSADKPKVGEFIEEGKAAGIDLSACDFQHIDRSNPDMMEASLKSIIRAEAIAEAGKAKLVGELANAGSSVEGLSELLASLKLTEHLGAADAWCVEQGADSVADLKEETYAEDLAEALQLKKIPAKKLVAAIRA